MFIFADHLRLPDAATAKDLELSVFAAAMVAALWAFDGWNNMPMVAAEIRDAQKNVPRALILGTLIVISSTPLSTTAIFWS